MAYLFRKIQAAIVLALVASIGNVYGSYDYSSSDGDCGNCFSCESDCCGKVFFSADLLYWRTFESGIGICVPTKVFEDASVSDGFITTKFRGKGHNPHFRWNPGFRIGAGYEFACNWDVAVSWAHLHSNANNGSRLRWRLNFDAIDIMAGYNYEMSSCFDLRPYVGVRGARIEQKQHVQFASSSANNHTHLSSKNKENFWGVGPLIGLQGTFDLWCDFSLYANASVSWLYGEFDLKLREVNKSSEFFQTCNLKNQLDANVASADAGIGIRWNTCICNDIAVFVQLGLEHHRYFDFNRIGCYGDLIFDGVNFSVGAAF